MTAARRFVRGMLCALVTTSIAIDPLLRAAAQAPLPAVDIEEAAAPTTDVELTQAQVPAPPSFPSTTTPDAEPTLPPVIVRPPEAFESPSTGEGPATGNFLSSQTPPNVASPSSEGRAFNILGMSESASEGYFGQPDIVNRPILRPAETLELIPGMIVTQHSGSGKANQYFLRGYNLDHGTDFFASIDNVPFNLRTHGHGQGYLDLNSLIPELVDVVHFQKGPYYAEIGDFGSVGAADIRLFRTLPQSFVKFGGGIWDFWRILAADSSTVGRGDLLTVFEYQSYNGPWVVHEATNKYNGFMKYSVGDDDFGVALTAAAYKNSWTSTDQIPERAVRDGSLDRLGAVDLTDGGRTTRASLNAQYWNLTDTSATNVNAFFAYYDLDLFSNFTYFLDDEINGDQFQQADRRRVYGINLSHKYEADWATNLIGAQYRTDDIPEVGLFHTTRRQVISTTNNNRVLESSYSLFAQQEITVWDWVRPNYGLRGDLFSFDVNALSPGSNEGYKVAGILNPKAGVTFGPWLDTEFYFNWGWSFHSNDARGVVAAVDPATPLVRTKGEEIGIRTRAIEGLTSTLALWQLEQDSELLFVGDAGTNEPSRPSRRIGLEWTNFYQLQDWLTWDADVAFTHSRFTAPDPNDPALGDYIPGAIGSVVTTGPTVMLTDRIVWGLRLRYFGTRPLDEDNSIRSNYTALFNMHIGYNTKRFRASVDFLNLFNSFDQDITYYYESRLTSEPSGVGTLDRHFHPIEPFGARFNLQWMF